MPGSKRRREVARRRLERRMQRRAEQRARRRRQLTIAGAALATLAVIGGATAAAVTLSGGSSHHPAAAATPSPSATPSPTLPPGVCQFTKVTPGAGQLVKNVGTPPPVGANPKVPLVMTVVTNHGTIRIRLFNAQARCTATSFRFLAGKHYFDHTQCHRLTNEPGLYVLQCGDPFGTGTGGPGYEFLSENLGYYGTGATVTYPAGAVAMANSGTPNSNGSQFFLVWKASSLPPQYTPFGQVVSGMNVLQALARIGATPPADGKPRKPIRIERLTVTTG